MSEAIDTSGVVVDPALVEALDGLPPEDIGRRTAEYLANNSYDGRTPDAAAGIAALVDPEAMPPDSEEAALLFKVASGIAARLGAQVLILSEAPSPEVD